MHLRLRVARADRPPADQIADVLRCNRIQPFGRRRQPQAKHVGQHLACQPHALADIEAAIQIRVVDQTLPADRRARLLEIHAHHDHQSALKLALERRKTLRVLVRRFRIVNRARADDDQQTIIATVQDVADLLTRLQHQVAHIIGERQFPEKIPRCRNRVELANVHVHRFREHGIPAQMPLVLGTVRTTKPCHRSALLPHRRPTSFDPRPHVAYQYRTHNSRCRRNTENNGCNAGTAELRSRHPAKVPFRRLRMGLSRDGDGALFAGDAVAVAIEFGRVAGLPFV